MLIYNSSYFDYNGKINVSYGRNFKVTELADFVIYNSHTDEVLHTSPNHVGDGYIANNYSYFASYYNSLTDQKIEGIKIEVKLKPLIENSILKLRERLTIYFYNNRFSNLIYFLLTALMSITLFAFLLYAAGNRKGCKNISKGILERIPFDVFSIIIGGIMYILFMLCIGISDNISYTIYSYIEPLFLKLLGINILLLLGGVLFVVWSISLAKRIKLKITFKSCVVYKFLNFILNKLSNILLSKDRRSEDKNDQSYNIRGVDDTNRKTFNKNTLDHSLPGGRKQNFGRSPQNKFLYLDIYLCLC